jgi:hypothetical protein
VRWAVEIAEQRILRKKGRQTDEGIETYDLKNRQKE